MPTSLGVRCLLPAWNKVHLEPVLILVIQFAFAMGATLSSLGYTSHKQHYHERVPQQLHPDCGPIPILGSGDAASSYVIDLCTRLGALEKDLQISRAENSNKEAVIQYLLQSNVSNAGIKELTVQLERQLLILKAAMDRTKKENEEIREKVGKAEEAIVALSSMNGIPCLRPQSTSTSFSGHIDSPAKREAMTEDLIDMLDHSQGLDSAKSIEEDITLPDELYEDESDIEGVIQRTSSDQAPHQSSDLEFEGPSYLMHFVDTGEDAKPQDTVTLSTEVLRRSFTLPQQQYRFSGCFNKSDDSSRDNSSSPSGLDSTAISFSSTSSGTSTLYDVDFKLLNEEYSQLKVLESEGSNLDKYIATVSTSADNPSSSSTRNHAEPPGATLQAPTKAENQQVPIRCNTIKPRWSSEETSDSAQRCETIVSVNRGSAQTGAKNVPYPEFFKYGIHYIPKLNEHNLYRTVAISGILPSVTMKALLEKVRGGTIVDAKILDTVKITGSNTALVTFLYECSAVAYEEHARQHPIAFSNVFARISVVSTPTWPMLDSLRLGIEESGHTRCLEVHNIPSYISLPAVREELRSSPVMKSDSIEWMRLSANGVLRLRFSCIRAAVHSSDLFIKASRYRGCTFKYIPDPCAQPLETLLKKCVDSSEAVGQDTCESFYSSDAKAGADGESGRLTKINWDLEPELRRGRGFKEQADSAIDASNDLGDHNVLPSSASTGGPLRRETAASIASFAKSFFPSE